MPKIITYKYLLLKQNVHHNNSVQFVTVSTQNVALIYHLGYLPRRQLSRRASIKKTAPPSYAEDRNFAA